MNIFEQAFKRSRSEKYKRGGRNLSDFMLSINRLDYKLPEYITYYYAAQAKYENGQYEEALNFINDTIKLSDIDDWKQYAFKANVLEDLQNYAEAIKFYEIAIDIHTDDVRVYALYHQIGFCYLSLGNHNKAIEFYSYAIELKQQHPNCECAEDEEGMDKGVVLGVPFNRMYNNRGNSLKNIGKLNEALQDCQKALSYDSNYSNPYLLMGQIYAQAGQEENAIQCMRVSARLGNQAAQRMLNQIDMNQILANKSFNLLKEAWNVQNFQLVKKSALDILDLDKIDGKYYCGFFPYYALSLIYATEENWSKCEYVTDIALKLKPDDPVLLNHMGVAICSQSINRVLEGLTYFKRGCDLGDIQNCGGNYSYWHKKINNNQ